MGTYILTKTAENDLSDIYIYSDKNWGAFRAEDYLEQLFAGFQVIADAQNIGRSIHNIAEGVFVYQVGSHLIFYKIADTVQILRILHKSMDPTQQL